MRRPFADVQWSADGRPLAFVSTSRDHKRATLRIADAETGEVRTVLEESAPTSSSPASDRVNWRFLPGSNECSGIQRDDWGHLYLYDLTTGQLKNRDHQRELERAGRAPRGRASRTVWLTGAGREAGRSLLPVPLSGRSSTAAG